MRDLVVTASVVVPGAELVARAVRASGPGGQNVNKVSTKIELRFDFAASRALDASSKHRLRALAAGRIDALGRIVIVSQRTRSRELNLEDARQRLAVLLRRALVPPKPRKPTAPSRAARARRLADKRRHARRKAERSRLTDD